MSLRRNFEDTTGRQETRNLSVSAEIRRGNKVSLIFVQSWGKHCLLEQTFVSSNMTFQNPEATLLECLSRTRATGSTGDKAASN